MPWVYHAGEEEIFHVLHEVKAAMMKNYNEVKCYGYLMQKQESLEKNIILGKIKGNKKRTMKTRWIDITDTKRSLQELKQLWSGNLALHHKELGMIK